MGIHLHSCRVHRLLPKRDEVVFVDIDSKVKQVYGPAMEGASFGYTEVRGLHFQIVTRDLVDEPSAPVGILRASALTKGSTEPPRPDSCAM